MLTRLVNALTRRTFGLELDDFLALGCGVVTETDPQHGGIALTFDDGPSTHSTLSILDILDEHGAHATFFLLGENAIRHPEIAREISRRGHEVGSHSHSHVDFHRAAPWTVARELRMSKQTLEDISGAPVTALRAPFGHFRWDVRPIARALGFSTLVNGSIVPRWDETDPEAIVSYTLARVRPGSIICLHDATNVEQHDARGLCRAVVDALGPLLTALGDRDLHARKLSRPSSDGR